MSNENNASQMWDAAVTDEEVEIDLVEIFYLLWDNIIQIILCFVVGAVIAFGYSYAGITPMYKATAKMYIVSSSSNSAINLSDLQISSNLKSDYSELLKSRPMLQDAIASLGIGETCTYEQLARQLSVTNPSDTRILYITVTDADPQMAADKANEIAKQAKSYLPKTMNTEAPNVYENAVVPTRKSSPSYSRNTIIGAMLGALAYCAYLIIRFLMNDTLTTADDVYKYLGIQPLATIPEGDLKMGQNEKTTAAKKKKKAPAKKENSKA
ncbi:MAG: hypothetical protein IKD69_14460 [Solobacterium sp.]|nr:hypothetical protein [Solobacterium sp.]